MARSGPHLPLKLKDWQQVSEVAAGLLRSFKKKILAMT